MEQNFDLLAQSRANYYTKGSPVQFVRVELLKGDVTGEVAVCLTFKNISQEVLSDLVINFKCKNAAGEVVCEAPYHYESLNVNQGELFGQDDAVYVASGSVGSVDVELKSAEFASGEALSLEQFKRVRLPVPRALPPELARRLKQKVGSEEDLSCQLEQVNGRIRALEQYDAALTLAQQALTAASGELQRRFAPRICQSAQKYLSRLTLGRYRKLTLGTDFSLGTGAAGEDTLRDALWRSDGTADQLYLALRLSVARELTPEAPLILDDALVRFDEDRVRAALDLLTEIALDKQVLLFTCQQREEQILNQPVI